MPSFEVHAGQAPQPWPAWTFFAMSICCSRVAWWATGAYLPPPKASQVDLVNCRPPEKPLPVLIDQFPPDSHWARRSHTPPDAAAGAEAPVLPDSEDFSSVDSVDSRSELRFDLVSDSRFSVFGASWTAGAACSSSTTASGSGSGAGLVPLATTSVTGSATTFSETSSDSVTSPSTTVSV